MQRTILVFLLCLCTAGAVVAQNIVRVEYFFNTDPGFGNATAVAITPNSTIADLTFTANVSGLGNGLHYLMVRSQDANGKWSMVNKRMIYREMPASTTTSKIAFLEYFINVDPGMGKGISIPITKSENIQDLVASIDINGYAPGNHFFFLRAMDEAGKYSVTNIKQFEISGILPLTLIDYRASVSNNTIKHTWITMNEADMSHFIVERSTDGINFSEVGKVEAKNQKEQQQYFFTEALPASYQNGLVIYYRLKMADKSGSSSYSKLVTVRPEALKHSVVSPNPATDFINVAVADAKSITITSLNGQVVYRANLNPIWERHTISFDKLPKGLYIVKVVKTDNQTIVEKLIIK